MSVAVLAQGCGTENFGGEAQTRPSLGDPVARLASCRSPGSAGFRLRGPGAQCALGPQAEKERTQTQLIFVVFPCTVGALAKEHFGCGWGSVFLRSSFDFP